MEVENTYRTANRPDESVILRYIRNIASEEEKVQVDMWLKEEPEQEPILLQIAHIYYTGRTQERIASRDTLKAYEQVKKRMDTRKKQFLLRRSLCYVACFLLGLAIPFTFYKENAIVQSSTSQKVEVRANVGMRTRFQLPDGTVVYLNSGSTLSYPLPYDRQERRVNLSGEAYFEVVRNPSQPFIVDIQDSQMSVKVLGTVFDVRAYERENTIQTTLVSGAVNLVVRENDGTIREKGLSPSEKAIFNVADKTIKILPVDVESETAWKDGRLVFKETPLPEVLKRLANFYNVDFDVKTPEIESYCFTGTFVDRELSQILDYLKISSNIDYSIHRTAIDDSLLEQRMSVELQMKK